MKIVHLLPQNSTICGGIKVHYQLSELEQELGYRSVIAFPNTIHIPAWFQHTCTVMSYEEAKNFIDSSSDDLTSLVIGWEDPKPVLGFSATHKACYIQGEVFVNRTEPYAGISLWYSSFWNKQSVGKPGEMIPPFVDSKVFVPGLYVSGLPQKVTVLVQERKFGKERWSQVLQYLGPEIQERLDIRVLSDVPEEQFAQAMRETHIFFAHSYPEGFGLPALEAMASNVLVVGYSGGGGRDFMITGKNCYYAADGDAASLAKGITKLLFSPAAEIEAMRQKGRKTAERYSREMTRASLRVALEQLVNNSAVL